MNPRRLIPYVVVFLVLVGTYVGLRWHQAQKETREQQAKQVFTFKEAEISALTLKRGKEEIQLTRQGAVWEITKPVKAKADQETVDNLVQALAELKKERDLGPGEAQDLRPGPGRDCRLFYRQGKATPPGPGASGPGGPGLLCPEGQGPQYLADQPPAPGNPWTSN